MPYTIKPGSFKYKKSNGQFSEIDCFEGPDLTEEVTALEKGKAPIIIDSATGNPIVIKDGADGLPVEGMKIHFLPKQNLNGQDTPYPPGGGKNKLSIDIDVAEGLNPGFTRNGNTLSRNGVDFTFNDDGTIKVNGTATGNYSYLTLCEATFLSDSPSGTYILNGCPSGGAASKYNIDVAGASGCDTGNGISLTYTETLTNVAVRIRVTENTTVNNLIFKPMIRLASITDDAFAPYSNICPIEGWTGVTAFRTGVNVWDEELELGGINSSTGIPYTSTSALRAKNYIPVVPGAKYYFKSSSTSATRCWYDKDKNYISTGYVVNMEITAPNNAYFFRFDIPSSYGTTYKNDISLNYPSTDTEYHPYTGQSYPVTFPALGKNLMNSPSFGNSGVLLNDFGKDTYFDAITFSFKANNTIAQYTNAAVVDLREEDGTHHYIVLSVCKNSSNVAFKANTETSGTYSRTLTSIKFRYVYAWYTGSSYSYFNGDNITEWQLELGTTATAYEPYMNIYGGTLDVVNWVLTATHKCAVYDGSNDETWDFFAVSTGNLFRTQQKDRKSEMMNSQPSSYFCNSYSMAANTTTGRTNGKMSGIYTDVDFINDSYNSVESWREYLAENPIQFVYQLATPIEIQLDPITVQTLLGDNVIWSDANGDIEFNYRADTKLFVDKNNPVTDVKINGTSIIENNIANIPKASLGILGAVKVANNYGLDMLSSSSSATDGYIRVYPALDADIKNGGNGNYPFHRPITPYNQHKSVFYGLAKLAGADMSSSSNVVGQFTDDAKSKISDMLNAPVSISGTTPSITGKSGLQYICGEVSTLSVVAPSSGCIDIVFKSGSTPTVLTITSAKANTTIKWANGFDPTALEANTTYEINILDGEFGVVGSWM